MFETGENSGWLVKHYANTTPAALSSSLFYEVYKVLPNDTDLTIFKEHGLQGLNFAHAERLPHYHTPLDNLANLNKGSLQHHGDNVWGVLKSILNTDLNKVEQGNLVYTDVLGQFVIHWDEASSLWISLTLVTLFLLLAYRRQKASKLDLKALLKTCVGILLILVVSAVTAFIIQKLVLMLGSSHAPWRANNLPMQIAIWVGVSLTGLTVAKWLSKNSQPIDLAIGVLLTWVILSLITSLFLPGISFLFILPSLIGLTTLLVISLLPSSGNKQTLSNIEVGGLITIILAVAIFFMPMAYVLEIMVSYEMAIAIGLMLSFIISSFIPLLALDFESKRAFNKLSVAHIIIVTIAVSWTSLQAPFTSFMPQPLNMLYLQTNVDSASIITGNKNTHLSKDLIESLKGTKLKKSIPWSAAQFNTSIVSSQKIRPAVISIIKESIDSKKRIIKIKLDARDDKLSDVKIYIPNDSLLEKISSGEDNLYFRDELSIRNGYFEYHCRGQSCSEFALSFEFSSMNRTKILVAKVLQGLPQELKIL